MKKPEENKAGTETTELEFSYDLRETSRLLLSVLKKCLEPHDITLTQYFLLRQVWGAEGISQGVLSERLGTTQPATVATVDALEKRGLIRRVRNTKDRRFVRLMLTARGKEMRETLLGYAHEMSERALAGVSATDVAHVRTILNYVRNNLARELSAMNDARELGA